MAAEPRYRLAEEIAKKEPSLIALIDLLIEDALARGASDIHIDPSALAVCIRFRIDGELEAACPLPHSCHQGLIARLKILAGLRTDEHQKPHDGRFVFESEAGYSVDIRLSILPTHYGENAVLRLLTRGSQGRMLPDLGMSNAHQQEVADALPRNEGFILIVGPTGSGKTTTLYAMLQMLAGTPRSLVTIEDPVEYVLPGATQIPVISSTAGLTFASALRSVLRQDPDVILIGEIRDTETAQLAASAALTGHLVLSTLHAANARGAAPRLIDMGVDPYLVSATVRLVIAQRLVRTLCSQCRTRREPSADDYSVWTRLFGELFPVPNELPLAVGCDACGKTGYRGRIGLFELAQPLMHDGYEKLSAGHTTLEELARVHYA